MRMISRTCQKLCFDIAFLMHKARTLFPIRFCVFIIKVCPSNDIRGIKRRTWKLCQLPFLLTFHRGYSFFKWWVTFSFIFQSLYLFLLTIAMSALSAHNDAPVSGSDLLVYSSICLLQNFGAVGMNQMRLEAAKRRLSDIPHSSQVKKRKLLETFVDKVELKTELVDQDVCVHTCSSTEWTFTKHGPRCAPSEEIRSP